MSVGILLFHFHQGVIYYELLKTNETITGDRYRIRLMSLSRFLKKNGRYTRRDTTKRFCYMTTLGLMLQNQWNLPGNASIGSTTPPAPSDFHLFRSMEHGLDNQRFHSYEEAENGSILE